MAIGSSLTKVVRRTGEINKPQLKSASSDSIKTNSTFRKGSNQGDSDSEFTSFSSSVYGSTSSSADRFSSSVQGGNRQNKTVAKLNSRKPIASGSIRRPQSRLMRSPDDDRAAVEPLQKPMQKLTRSGSLRSLRIARKKNMTSSESKALTVEDSHSKKATFSSILKDSKFPHEGVKESEKEVVSAAKLCPYEHCSLRGHHHGNHEPPLKRFSYLKRRSSKDQKGVNKQPVKKNEVKVTKKVSDERRKKTDVDFSVEFYARTRSEPSFEPNGSRDDVHLADTVFGVNGDSLDGFGGVEGKKPGFDNDSQMSMWRLFHQRILSSLVDQQRQDERQSCFDDDEAANQEKETQKMFAIKMVRDAFEKILLTDEDSSGKNQGDDGNERNQAANDGFSTKRGKSEGWNRVKRVVLMMRFIRELEKSTKNKLGPDKRGHVPLVPEPEPEAEIVSLRSRTTSEKKKANEWMVDYALQQVVAELAPTQRRKVALLVKSFEMVTPKQEKEVSV